MLARFIAVLAGLHVVGFLVGAAVLGSAHLLFGAVVMALVLAVAVVVAKGAARRAGPDR